MKKLVLKLAAVVLFIPLCACSVGAVNNMDPLYKEGLESVQIVDKMAESEEYITLYTANNPISEIIKEIGKQDYKAPKATYKVTVSKEALDKATLAQGVTNLPEEILPDVRTRMFTSIPSRLNALNGAETLAATTCITSGNCFIAENVTDYTMYFYLYDGKYAAAVAFIPYENNIVSSNTTILVNETINNVTSKEDFTKWIMENANLADCVVEKI